MDLVNAAVGFKQAEVATRIQYAVAGKMLSSQKQQGAAVLQLLDAASQTQATAGDALVAAATGLGGELDVRA